MDLFDGWGVKEAGLFTFAQSAKHVGLYQKFGFWPRFLTALMSKAVGEPGPISWSKYSALAEGEQTGPLRACRDLTDSIFEGLDVSLGKCLRVSCEPAVRRYCPDLGQGIA